MEEEYYDSRYKTGSKIKFKPGVGTIEEQENDTEKMAQFLEKLDEKVEEIYKKILETYKDDISRAEILDKMTFDKFLRFMQKNSPVYRESIKIFNKNMH